MRSMPKLSSVCVALGLLIVSAQSAQACHGRRGCSMCAGKAYRGAYSYAGVGYGYAPPTGYGQNYCYAYPSTYKCDASRKSGPSDVEKTTPAADDGVDARLARIEERLRVDENAIESRLKGLETSVGGMSKDLDTRLDRIEAMLAKVQPTK